jgi:class 3 adenylate cyclase
MTTIPDVRYARSGDVAIAYQVVGEGPVDLVFVPFFGNIRWAWEQPLFARFLERLASFARLVARTAYPSLAGDPAFLRWHGDYLRFAASPGAAAEFFRMVHETDISDVLPTIRVPTLVIHRARRRDAALRVAELVPGARAVQTPGDDLGPWIGDEVPAEVERFLRGGEEAPVPDSVLTTILFTDIVGSTERAAALGDRDWRDLLARHHAAVRRELARFRGQELDTAGDGRFATFDGPARAIRCAQSIVAQVADIGLDLRAGLHTGECELHDGKPVGIAVSVGSRVAGEAGPGQVVVSGTVRDLVAGSGIEFEDLGVRALKGVPDEWRLYTVRA